MVDRVAYNNWQPPAWSGVFELYSKNWVRKHFWRVKHCIPTQEDALQECGVVFARCVRSYVKARRVNNHAWFMSLYQRALANQWNSFSVKDSQRRELLLNFVSQYDLFEEGSNEEHRTAEALDAASTNWGPMLGQLRSSAGELFGVLSTLANAPNDTLAALFSGCSPDRQRTRISKLKKTDDDFVIDCVREFVRMRLASPNSLIDGQELLRDLALILGSDAG
jgi:hypothetical protein